ncbi:heat shock cognate 70 kDa protein [Canna indica]|uniref:Heat shock cognate 70 kDa protein n=1 Tax=Canna indica TaxID=4628 RepID=A0AAQ3QCT0_9LILI|nr:heat shock cognate 70 kDa protein [Canna indica]
MHLRRSPPWSSVLTKMKQIGEAYFDTSIKNIVIIVPAMISSAKPLGMLALSPRLAIAPIAVAITYNLDKKASNLSEKKVSIFNLSGGTFGISLLTIEEGIFKVKAAADDAHLDSKW